jgi:hypothetical protein
LIYSSLHASLKNTPVVSQDMSTNTLSDDIPDDHISPDEIYKDQSLIRPKISKQAFKVGGVRRNHNHTTKLPKNDTTNLFNTTTNKKWAATCKKFDKAHIKDDNITVGKLGLHDIRIGFLNINGFKDD